MKKPTKKTKPRKKRASLKHTPKLAQMIGVVDIAIRKSAGQLHELEIIRFCEMISNIVMKMASEAAGIESPDEAVMLVFPSSAFVRLHKEIASAAEATNRDPDAVTIELLGKMAPHGIPFDRWN